MEVLGKEAADLVLRLIAHFKTALPWQASRASASNVY